jgi:hypothetical protein
MNMKRFTQEEPRPRPVREEPLPCTQVRTERKETVTHKTSSGWIWAMIFGLILGTIVGFAACLVLFGHVPVIGIRPTAVPPTARIEPTPTIEPGRSPPTQEPTSIPEPEFVPPPCPSFGGHSTTPLPDGGCKYEGPIIKAKVPQEWWALYWTGKQEDVARSRETIVTGEATFYLGVPQCQDP